MPEIRAGLAVPLDTLREQIALAIAQVKAHEVPAACLRLAMLAMVRSVVVFEVMRSGSKGGETRPLVEDAAWGFGSIRSLGLTEVGLNPLLGVTWPALAPHTTGRCTASGYKQWHRFRGE